MKKKMECCGKGCDKHEENMKMMTKAKEASNRSLIAAVGIGLVLLTYAVLVTSS